MSELAAPIALYPRVILVGGQPRTGKTTVGREVARLLGANTIDTDDLRTIFDGFPETAVGYAANSDGKTATAALRVGLERLVATYVTNASCIVISGELIDPRMAAESPYRDQMRVCFLGLNDPAAAFDRIRQHGNPHDWISQYDDDQLQTVLAKFAARSDELQATCAGLGIAYYDTSAGVPGPGHEVYELLVPQHLGFAALQLAPGA